MVLSFYAIRDKSVSTFLELNIIFISSLFLLTAHVIFFLQDRRQFGPAPNKLLGDSANMETSLNIEMKGTGRENAPWKRISQAHQNVEMSLRYNIGFYS